MNFFDYVKNEAFFKPLTLKYKRIYYDCIQILIDKAKELPVLYENDARDALTIYLKSNGITENTEEVSEEENAEEESTADLQAFKIIALFRECGWLTPREIGRNGEYVVNLTTECRRVMDFLKKMTEKSSDGVMSNRIFSMYEILKSSSEEDSVRKERPYTNILLPLMENETELKNELTDLKNSISTIMKAVIVFQDINSFGQYLMKDEMLEKFFSEYFFIKNNGLIPAQISFIRGRLRLLREDEITIKMAQECAEQTALTIEDAQEKIDSCFAELQHFFSVEYENHMELIDSRINNYYNLANTRIMLMTSNGANLETRLNDFLNALAKLPNEEQDAAFSKASDCVRLLSKRYVGSKSFEKRRQVKADGADAGILIDEMSEEEMQEETDKLFNNALNRYSFDKVKTFLDAQLQGSGEISLKDRKIHTKEEVLMYAAAMLYSQNTEFPYEMELSDEVLDTGLADISGFTLTRKK